jgi:nicotinamide mononucleotide transporter
MPTQDFVSLVGLWLSQNYIETIAALLGLFSIFFQIKQKIWYWPVSIVMVSLYIYVYFVSKLYADISLQVYYLIISFYGWYHWLHGQSNGGSKNLSVSRLSGTLAIRLVIVTIILFVIISLILKKFTDSDVPYWDAFINALSFVATWMLARKILENWLFWIIADAFSIGIYIYKGLYPTMILFIVLTILAVVGYNEWLKDYRRSLEV